MFEVEHQNTGDANSQMTRSMPAFIRYLSIALAILLLICGAIAFILYSGESKLNLDGQSLVGLASLAIGSAIGLAGALVVIKIADQQERLALQQTELARQQAASAAQQTARYQALYTQAQDAINGTRNLLMLYSMLLATYRMFAQQPSKLHGADNSPFTPIVRRIAELLLEPWTLVLAQYCKLTNRTSAVDFHHSLAMVSEAAHRFLAEVTTDESGTYDEHNKRKLIWLLYRVGKLGETLYIAKAVGSFAENQGQPNDDYKISLHNPTLTAFFHQELSRLNETDFALSDEVMSVVTKHHDTYSCFDTVLFPRDGQPAPFKLLLDQKFADSKGDQGIEPSMIPVRVFQEAGASEPLEHIILIAKHWAGMNGLKFRQWQGVENREEIEDLRKSARTGKTVNLIYVAGAGGVVKWLFANYIHLDRCIIVCDGIENATWQTDYANEIRLINDGIENRSWAAALRLFSARAVDATKSHTFDPEMNPYTKSGASPRTLWVTLQSIPDFRNLPSNIAHKTDYSATFGALLERFAATEGRLFRYF